MELWEEIQNKQYQLNLALKSLRTNGTIYAQAEKDYKEAISKEILRLKDEGMAATLITQVIYGLPSVSTLRFNRDTAKVVYEANQESINIKKLELRIIEAQLEREWGNAKNL